MHWPDDDERAGRKRELRQDVIARDYLAKMEAEDRVARQQQQARDEATAALEREATAQAAATARLLAQFPTWVRERHGKHALGPFTLEAFLVCANPDCASFRPSGEA